MTPRFVGDVDARWIGPRVMQLLAPFDFIDFRGDVWQCFEGTKLDGSSNPWWLQPVLGTPFVGLHRYASVPHDLFCRIRKRSWQDTHRMYFEGLIIAGVPDGTADRRHWALRKFGPKWTPSEIGRDAYVVQA